MSDDLPLLMALRVQGITPVERAACALGVDPDAAAARLTALTEAELATERTGRLAGFTLTPKGLEALDALLERERAKGAEELMKPYESFLQLNPRVLKVSSDWQTRRDGSLNDHSDAAYDYGVVERLIQLHDRARVCLQKVAGCDPRFERYLDRLESCAQRLGSGDTSAFTTPLAESYHTVWFELHQDLLLTLGLKREE